MVNSKMPTRNYRNLEIRLQTNNFYYSSDFASAILTCWQASVEDAADCYGHVYQSIHALAGMQAEGFDSVVS